MAFKEINSAIIQLHRGTAAAWTANNPTLAIGEPGYETDTGKLKIGNGTSAWNNLSYFNSDVFRYETMPTADSTNVNKIYQYIGTTTSSYTQGYFYKNVNTQITESIIAVESDNADTLEITGVDAATFKSKLSPGTYNFLKKGYPTKLSYSNISAFPPVSLELTRESAFDKAAQGIYVWISNTNDYYATMILNPEASDALYTYDITEGNIQEQVTDYMFVSSSEPSAISGYWTIQDGNSYEPVSLSSYGIQMTTNGLPGNSITVTYIAASNTYAWTQINVQPT